MSSLTRQVHKAKLYMRDMMPNKFDYEEIRQSDETADGTSDEFAKSHLLGSKSLGLFSSIVIVVNNIAGPGMLVLPMVYQVLTNAITKRTYVHICLAHSFVPYACIPSRTLSLTHSPQEAGWVVPTVVLLLICVGSGFAATFLVDTMARIPENGRFQRRIEFVNIFEEYWGMKGMYIAQVSLFFIYVEMYKATICERVFAHFIDRSVHHACFVHTRMHRSHAHL